MGLSEWPLDAKTLKMILFKRSADLRDWLTAQKNKGRKTGFVPTMGALHNGHIHLIENCRNETEICICSIFVNPVQFNDPGDYDKYPVQIEKDIEMLERAGTAVLFLPSVAEIYPNGKSALETYDLSDLENKLEGRYRPGHFQGVCQVMSRLLRSVKPDHLFMGQKDFQQCLIIKRLIDILGLSVEFHAIPTVRESDGLALSSRNLRLDPDQRRNAVAISQVLQFIKEGLRPGKADIILKQALEQLDKAHFRTDYVEIAGAENLRHIESWDGNEKAVALIAAFQGEVRLIDNMLLN